MKTITKKMIEEAVREVVEETFTNRSISGELWNYRRMGPETTGLGVDIFVDENESHLIYKHPRCIYFRNSYNSDDYVFLPMLLDEQPHIPDGCESPKISMEDIELIKSYIKKNLSVLILMSDSDVGILYSLNEEGNNKEII
jgi:hypothetical protein